MFSTGQLERLEERFHQNQYLIGKERVELAKELDLSEMQVLFAAGFPMRRKAYCAPHTICIYY